MIEEGKREEKKRNNVRKKGEGRSYQKKVKRKMVFGVDPSPFES